MVYPSGPVRKLDQSTILLLAFKWFLVLEWFLVFKWLILVLVSGLQTDLSWTILFKI
jgi:hypothetical protein